MAGLTYTHPLLPLVLIVIAAGLIRAWRGKGLLLPVAGLVCLFLVSWPPIDYVASRPLEAQYRPWAGSSQPAEAIVVLSSAVDPPKPARPFPVPDRDTYQRCEFGAWLHRNWRPLPVLACGGFQGGKQSAAVDMKEFLRRAGVPESMILTEEQSTSTHENAVFGAAILRERGIRRIVLVTEAYAMPRAAACFRREGLTVVPAPCSFREWGPGREELLPTWKSIARNEGTLHELLGYLWYAIRGWV